MTVGSQVASPVIFGVGGATLAPAEREFFAQCRPMGFILFARNLDTSDQIIQLCHDLRGSVGWHAPILIDQEGGRVQRLRPPLAREWAPPLDHANVLGDTAARDFKARFALIGHDLRQLGIDVNCAPCLDIARPQTHAFLQNRCYATTADRVIELGQAAYDGLKQAGVMPVIKHMPGHGLAHVDSHLELPRVSASLDDLLEHDFRVFSAFQNVEMAMTAHIVFDAIDPDRPATTSPKVVQFIRQTLGFDGLLVSDDLSMQALPGTISERARDVMTAGCDAVLHCNGDLDEMKQVMTMITPITDAIRARFERAVNARNDIAQATLDIDGLTAQLGL